MEKNPSINYRQRFKPHKQRGVAEIIGSLMLVAITVVGATILTTFLNGTFVAGGLSTASSQTIGSVTVNLIGYDTRDSSTLMKIVNLNNKFDGKLCGIGCSGANLNKIPTSGGSEFFIIQVENRGINSIFLQDIYLNNVDHIWDSQTRGIPLNTLVTDTTGKYPLDGKFSILPTTPSPVQNIDNQIQGGKTVNLLVKLGSKDQDIILGKSMRVLLNVGNMKNVDLVIESGDAR